MIKFKKAFYIIFLSISYTIFSQENNKIDLNNLSKFEIPLSESTNKNSIYFYKNIEDKLKKIDTSLTSEQIISLTKFNNSKNKKQTKFLDSLCKISNDFYKEEKYSNVILICNKILHYSPNNLFAIKELAFVHKKLGNEKLSNSYYSLLIKILKAIFKYSDGSFEYPFILNNYSEGITIYEIVYQCKPNKTALILDENKRLLGAYYGYSSKYDEIIINYSNLTHSFSELKENEYISQ